MARRRQAWVAAAAVALLGCGGLAGLRRGAEAPVTRAPGPVAVRFTSEVADPYEVLSGPAESYRRVRVNEKLKARLDGWSREKAGPTGGDPLEVSVHLARVATSFQRLGALDRPRVRLARAAWGSQTAVDAGVDAFGFGAFDSTGPEQITKGVEVCLAVEVKRAGQVLRAEALSATATEVLERGDITGWSYDYAELLDEALRRAVAAVDAAVDRALGRSGSPP